MYEYVYMQQAPKSIISNPRDKGECDDDVGFFFFGLLFGVLSRWQKTFESDFTNGHTCNIHFLVEQFPFPSNTRHSITRLMK